MRQSPIFFLFILFFLFIIFPSATSLGTNQVVEETCKNYSTPQYVLHHYRHPGYRDRGQKSSNDSYDFCKASLEAVPASASADLRGLGRIAISLLRNNATGTQGQINGLLGGNNLDLNLEKPLEKCLEIYTDDVKILTGAMKNYMDGKFDDIAFYINSLVGSFDSCEYGLHHRGSNPSVLWFSPLRKQYTDACRLAGIAITIMDMLRS